jgi:hypothetical protein
VCGVGGHDLRIERQVRRQQHRHERNGDGALSVLWSGGTAGAGLPRSVVREQHCDGRREH